MRELTIREMELVSGGGNADACSAAIIGATGIGASAAGVPGLAGGPVIAALLGILGGVASAAYAAANNPACQPPAPPPPPPATQGKAAGPVTDLDGDEV